MDDPLRILAGRVGFFTRAEAREAGYDDRAVNRMIRRRVWTRIRRGAYTYTDLWECLDDVSRHRVRSSAVLRSLGDNVALSHVSGAVRHGIDVWGLPLDRVHVTRLDGGAGRIEGDVVHHEGFSLRGDILRVEGEQVLRPERCVLEAASRASNEAALCMFDCGLRLQLYDNDLLSECHQLLQFWPFMRHLHVPVRMADGCSGSVGESRGRWLFYRSGLPAPDLQYEIRDDSGFLVGTCDWGWADHQVVGEFDGQVKYGRLLRPGQEPGDVVFAEKQREDRIREVSGMRMVRIVWSDYEHPSVTAQRVEKQLARIG